VVNAIIDALSTPYDPTKYVSSQVQQQALKELYEMQQSVPITPFRSQTIVKRGALYYQVME
jgi:hypothetical protein